MHIPAVGPFTMAWGMSCVGKDNDTVDGAGVWDIPSTRPGIPDKLARPLLTI